MNTITRSLIGLALALPAGPAFAQDTPPAEPADAVPPAATPPTATADAAASIALSDAEIDSFAAASVELREIVADTTLDTAQKQKEMVAAITGAGLEPARFNEIAKAVDADTELRAKVELAMAKHSAPEEG